MLESVLHMNEKECYYAANLVTMYAGQDLVDSEITDRNQLRNLTQQLQEKITSLIRINERLGEIEFENFCQEYDIEVVSQRSGVK
ncbi:hypothetical protein CKP12_14825 [Listeria monocytogenes]|nr:hypothetical protein [Listeria monocytogenes]